MIFVSISITMPLCISFYVFPTASFCFLFVCLFVCFVFFFLTFLVGGVTVAKHGLSPRSTNEGKFLTCNTLKNAECSFDETLTNYQKMHLTSSFVFFLSSAWLTWTKDNQRVVVSFSKTAKLNWWNFQKFLIRRWNCALPFLNWSWCLINHTYNYRFNQVLIWLVTKMPIWPSPDYLSIKTICYTCTNWFRCSDVLTQGS